MTRIMDERPNDREAVKWVSLPVLLGDFSTSWEAGSTTVVDCFTCLSHLSCNFAVIFYRMDGRLLRGQLGRVKSSW